VTFTVATRPPGPDDRDFFYELRHDGFRAYAEAVFGPWDEARQRASAERDMGELPVEIVERAGERVGYQILLRHADHWFLDEIAVIAAERGRGLGAQLVTTIMTAARAQDLPLRLSVLHVNPAQRLYARLGFRITRVEHPRIKMEWP
jgi:ribosomal protein S18 acetylase RimI-like enzyme